MDEKEWRDRVFVQLDRIEVELVNTRIVMATLKTKVAVISSIFGAITTIVITAVVKALK